MILENVNNILLKRGFMKSRIEELEEEIKKLKREQYLCKHEWEKVVYDPERVEIMREEIEAQGVDIWYIEVGTGRYTNKDRWSRYCPKCGKKEYTYEVEVVPVQIKKVPKF